MKRLLVGLAIAGCASGGKGNSIIGGISDAGPGDRGDFPEPDASPIDAPPQQVTLTQTAATSITRDNSFGCFRAGVTRENSYYRVFNPADHGITGTLHVTEVSFGIEAAIAGLDIVQPAQVKLGIYTGPMSGTTLDAAQIQPLAMAAIEIPDGEGTTMTVPITADAPSGMNLIVEIFIPDGLTDGNIFAIGTNIQGENKPGYTRGPACGVRDPTTMRSIAETLPGVIEADVLIAVTGMH